MLSIDSNKRIGLSRREWMRIGGLSLLLAEGGIRGGQVYGATSSTGGYVLDKPVSPADLTATILYHLGIDPATTYHDTFQRISQRLCEGTPVRELG